MSTFEPVPEISVSPTKPSGNYYSINLIRGVALLGLLFSSVLIFGGHVSGFIESLMMQPKGMDYRLYALMSFFLEGKMRALLAISFGAGMILYLFKSPSGNKIRNADYYIRRQLWLVFFGLVNALLFLWTKDLLYIFGIMGVLLFPFVRISPRGLLIASILFTLVLSGKFYWQHTEDKKTRKDYLAVMVVEKRMSADTAAQKLKLKAAGIAMKDTARYKIKTDTLTKKQRGEKSKWEGLVKNVKYTPKTNKEDLKSMQDTSYAKIWNWTLESTENWEAPTAYKRTIWDFGGMILLGMALFRFGFFEDSMPKSRYLLVGLLSLALGCILAWWRVYRMSFLDFDFGKYIDSQSLPFQFFYMIEAGLMAVGYASLVFLFSRSGFLTKIWRAFELVGQMAISNYILQTIICTIFFTGFGFGYYARLQQWQLYGFAADVALVNIVFSVFWLKYFHYGPVEWLWRCLVYLAWVPNRKRPHSTEPVNAII